MNLTELRGAIRIEMTDDEAISNEDLLMAVMDMNKDRIKAEEQLEILTKRNEDAMKLSMEQNEKFMAELEEVKDNFEKTMTSIVKQIWSPWMKEKFPFNIQTLEIDLKKGEYYPMDIIKECVRDRLRDMNKRLDMLDEKIDNGILMEREEWEDECDFDLDEAGELLQDYENGELVYWQERREDAEIANEKFLTGMREIEDVANVYGGESDDAPYLRQRTAEGVDIRDVAPYIKKLIEMNKKLEYDMKIWKGNSNMKKDILERKIEKLIEKLGCAEDVMDKRYKWNEKEEDYSCESDDESPKTPFNHIALETADERNDTTYFRKVVDEGHLPSALAHMKMTEPVFGEYKNFRKFLNEMNKIRTKAGCDLPYPPPLMVEGNWEDGCETVEREEDITREYIRQYGFPSLDSIKHFVDNYEGNNDMVYIVKKWLDKDNTIVYDGLVGLLEWACDEKKTKRVGEQILEESGEEHMEAMRCSHYLLSWYMRQSNNMCIGSYGRTVEHYWDCVGDWMA